MTRSLLPIRWSDCYLSSGHRFRFSNRLHKLLTATTLNHFLTTIGLLAAVAGMICLFSGSFSENQFKDAVKLKVVVFTILLLLVPVFLWKARKCNEVIEKLCHKHVHIKTVVKIVLLGCATLVNLLIKFPRFNVHYLKDKKWSIGEQGKHSQGSRFNLYSAGSFSAFALVISSKRVNAMELGIFDFLLGLTMDASMEIPGNDGLNLLYMLGAFVYCASLIFIRSCLESFMLSRDISGARQGNIPDLSMVLVEDGREDDAVETVNVVIYDPATEDCEETIALPHISMPKLASSNPIPNLMSLATSHLPDEIRTEVAPLGSLYFLPRKYRDMSHLIEINLDLSKSPHIFGLAELLFEDWLKNRAVCELHINSQLHWLMIRVSERRTYHGGAVRRSRIPVPEISYAGRGHNGGSVMNHFGLRRRNNRGTTTEISKVIPGILEDRLPNLQKLIVSGDYY